ncbi:carbon starvation CstA family protein [Pedobacter immunditicola]|uniref:carbon starvation CstA family protein n=1 Tax=Pedobacter immunditicola TaxID=3133440 RepID=UPI0030ABC77C
MISFLIAVCVLIVGYFFLSKICERIFGADPTRATPAYTHADGIDFVALPLWKIFLIQFLNIAGLGPIFGAVAGAMWGPVAFVWIVLGTLLAGGVHDYFSGMLSVKHKGESITEISGYYLGSWVKQFMRVFSIILLIMVGTVFIMGPAKILMDLTGTNGSLFYWLAVIFIYYVLSTVLPIDKLIGKIYPVFGVALLFMALGIFGMMFYNKLPIPEVTFDNLTNMHHNAAGFPIFPFVFVTIACGAISGFHATQSPLMARCMTNEKQGKAVFFGTMVTEGIVALIWAAISMSFFGGVDFLNSEMSTSGGNAALIVSTISNSLLGKVGGALAILGVVAAPITSGDTAFRSARLIIADLFKYNQTPISNRLIIAAPLFIIALGLLSLDFSIIWRYFAWTNQTLATVVLWTVTAYLIKEKKFYWISFFPAVFMTAVVVTYIFIAPEGLHLGKNVSYMTGILVAIGSFIATLVFVKRQKSPELKKLEEVDVN